MFNILTIDADYWYPLEQGGHCGHCRMYRSREYLCRTRESACQIAKDHTWFSGIFTNSEDDERTIPTHEQICRLVKPGTPIKVTESHAALHGIIMRLRRKGIDRIKVVNIDEHEDTNVYSYESGIHCGDWADYHQGRGHIDYRWIGDEDKYEHWRKNSGRKFKPDLVHVCKSSPFMSTKGDIPFAKLVLALEKKSGRKARIFGHGSWRLKNLIRGRRDG